MTVKAIPAKIFCFPRRLEDVTLQRNTFLSSKTSSRSPQGVFARLLLQDVLKVCLQDFFFKTSCKHVLKTSWKTDKNMLRWRRLQHVLTKTNFCWDASFRESWLTSWDITPAATLISKVPSYKSRFPFQLKIHIFNVNQKSCNKPWYKTNHFMQMTYTFSLTENLTWKNTLPLPFH